MRLAMQMPVSSPIGINSDVLKINAAQVTPNSGRNSFTGILFFVISASFRYWKNRVGNIGRLFKKARENPPFAVELTQGQIKG